MIKPEEKIRDIFDAEVKKYDKDPRACYWKSEASQWRRFEIMTQNFESSLFSDPNCSVVDVGCGQADFLGYLDSHGFKGQYFGVDISPLMIKVCQSRLKIDFEDVEQRPIFHCVDFMKTSIDSTIHDYVFASGIWNMKVWYDNLMAELYAKKVIEKMFRIARKGIAYNMLSQLGDWYNSSNHYYSPDVMLCHAFKFGRHRVILRHDYAPHDFTIIIDKENYK